MIALWAASLASAADVSAVVGRARVTPEPLSFEPGRTTFGLAGGASFGLDPLRFELQGTVTGTETDGTPAVSVDATRLEIAALGGVRGTLVDGRIFRFGADALAGPALTFVHGTTTWDDDRRSTLSLMPRAALAAGPWVSAGPVVLSGRVQLYAPIVPQWTAYATLGVRF